MEKMNIRCLVTGKETEGRISVFEEIVASKSGPPLHTHEDQMEIFHVISGHIQFEVGGRRIDVLPGGTAVIPPKARHTFINLSETESVIHFELLPSGSSEVFFEKLVSGHFGELPQLFSDHGLRLLGPPLEADRETGG